MRGWALGPGFGEWKMGLDQGEPRSPGSAYLGRVGRSRSEGRVSGRLIECLWESAVARGPTVCSLLPRLFSKLAPAPQR